MDINVTQEVINTVCKTLRANKQSLTFQLQRVQRMHPGLRAHAKGAVMANGNEEALKQRLAEVEAALEIFQNLEAQAEAEA